MVAGIVALLAEGVDRNIVSFYMHPVKCIVALLAEGVDRNSQLSTASTSFWVALLAEGVDRNTFMVRLPTLPPLSPSSRRAWIEIA